jgi:endonuclease/exonuclease/phosphatase family metal-dependent hydrolase
MKLTLATFNIRNITDRYAERKPVLGAGFATLDADIVGVQEVVFSPPRQDDFLSAQRPERHYRSFDARSDRNPKFGNATLCSVGDVLTHEELRLSHGRVVQRLLVALPGQRTLWFANTHLHHVPGEPQERLAQATAICEWMAAAPASNAQVIVGDFNTPPFEPAYGAMTGAGYRSAFKEANGAEPAVTWPSGIQAETMDTDGDPNCLDYIWLSGSARALTARLACNEAVAGDATLYPSDHFAIVAEVDV